MKPYRILLVENESVGAMDIENRLSSMGYQPVGRATTGEQALALGEQLRPDLVLMDLHLRGTMDGISAAEEMRRRFHVPVIFLAGRSDNATPDLTEIREPFSCVLKPFDDRELKSAIEIARHSNRNELLVRALGEIVYDHDVGSGRLEWEGATATILGYTIEEMGTGDQSWMDRVHSEDLPHVLARLNGLEPDSPFESEYRFRHKAGHYLWMLDRGVKTRDAAGNVPRVAGILRDITERKEAELSLAGEVIRRRILFEQSRDGIVILDQNGKVFEANQRYAEMLGYSPEEVRELHVWDWDARWTRKELEEKVRCTGSRGDQFETIHRRKDGSFFEVEITTNSSVWAGQKLVHCVCRDTSQRKEAEKTLRDLKEIYSTILNQAADGIVLIDTETLRFAEFNDSACQGLGYTREEFAGLTLADIQGTKTRGEVQECVRTVVEAGVTHFENKHRCKDGTLRHVEISNRVIHLHDRTYMAGIWHDITQRKLAEQEKERLETQLFQAQKMESVGRLAGGVAHDFNNMLGVIIGHAELALEDTDPEDSRHLDLQEIRKAAQRSADLTRQLLAFARKQMSNPRVLELNETLSGMLKMLRRLIGEDIALNWLPGADLWKMRLDPSQIDQILANLAVNARDAISGVGSITLKTENIVLDDSYLTDLEKVAAGEYVLLTVTDTGSGMPQEILDRIFEPFFTTKEVGKGTGLGLATVYGIVKQNNGFIEVTSTLGKGTTFRIYLPRFLTEQQESSSIAAHAPEGGTETILLVEDDESILQLCKKILERQGYTVFAAPTPTLALQLAESHLDRIHLLITDVVMPEMNGRELVDRLCALRPDLRYMYMSGYTADVVANRGVLNEDIHFIPKPFKRDELLNAVREILKK